MTRGFVPRHFSLASFPARITGRQRSCLRLKIDFGIDVGNVDGKMSEPRPYCGDVPACT